MGLKWYISILHVIKQVYKISKCGMFFGGIKVFNLLFDK